MRLAIPALLSTLVWLLPAAQTLAQPASRSTSHAIVRCDSFGRESSCPIDTSRGVRLIREFSRNRCVQNRTWGYDSFRIWVSDGCQAEFEIGRRWQDGGSGGSNGREVVCESRNNRETRCDVDTRGGVELVRQLSDAPCIRNRSWGFDRRAIWVNDGCRGRFQVGGGGSGWPGSGWGGGGTQRLTCESNQNRRQSCSANGTIRSVRLTRRLSSSSCTEGRSWGWTSRAVWVTDGCRAEFEVTMR